LFLCYWDALGLDWVRWWVLGSRQRGRGVAEHFDETVEADAVRAVGDTGDLDAALECVGVQAYGAFFLVLRIDVDFGVFVDKLGRCIAGSVSSSC
jgi:hypothetical protein